MDCRHVAEEEIAEGYLADRLPDGEREAFEAHFFECGDCFARVKALEAARDALVADPALARASRSLPRALPVAAAVAAVALAAALLLRGPLAPPGGGAPPESPGAAPRAAAVDLAELRRIEPPEWSPPRLRGGGDRPASFAAAMERYAAGDWAGAVAGLERAAAEDPRDATAPYFLGACLLLLDRPSEGVRRLEQAIALGDTPHLEDARLLLARGHLRLGNLPGARSELEAVARLAGDRAPEARALLARLPAPPP
jgi:tetratricopeptide (TPR) repeat protein